jgi:hypothetical protein
MRASTVLAGLVCLLAAGAIAAPAADAAIPFAACGATGFRSTPRARPGAR